MKPSKRLPDSSRNTPPFSLQASTRAFLRRVQNTAHAHALWQRETHFIVGVSGGPDSLCLLDALFLLSRKYAFSLHIAHVNYRLRISASDADEALVRARAKGYGLPISVLRPKVARGGNLEERLRETRYAFFEKLRLREKADCIAVGHNQDDQAETLLMRLLRGAGLRGLSAMQPKTGQIVRPLLFTSRVEILRYLKERGIEYRIDESNTDPNFFRNRIRHELLPLLEKKYQSQIRKILANTATLVAADYALLQPPTLETALSQKKLLRMPEAQMRHTLRTFLAPHFFPKQAPQGIVTECVKVIKSAKSKQRQVRFRGLKFECRGDRVTLLKN